MKPSDRAKFIDLMTDALAFYRRDVSAFALSVWWDACQGYELEQVSRALTAHAMNPERGQFAPMPADIVRELQGTKTDRSLVAWGKAYGAISQAGSYASVAFDDAVIHAVIEDMGGWPKLCTTTNEELPFVQKRFCETYRAYVARPDVAHLAVLPGIHDTNNAKFGRPSRPVLIGDPKRAAAVAAGPSSSRARITHVADALVLTHAQEAA